MKYYVEFQPLPKGAKRPLDDGQSSAAHSFEGPEGIALLPNIGDHVHLTKTQARRDFASFSGRVKSRLFVYVGNESCAINIVVEEVPDSDFAALVKE